MSFITTRLVGKIFLLGLLLLASFDLPAYTSEYNLYKENDPQVLIPKRSAKPYPDSKQPKLKKSKITNYGDIVKDVEKIARKSSISSNTPKKNITTNSQANNKNVLSNSQNGKVKKDIENQSIPRTPSYKELGVVPKKDIFYEKFCTIMKKSPNSITEPMQKITAEDEDRDGSRKWVKEFPSQEASIHPWHQDSAKIINLISAKNKVKKYLPPETNFALARIIYILEDDEEQSEDIPSFFISGWPSNANQPSIGRFSTDLSKGNLGEELNDYKNHELRFITQAYASGKAKALCERDYFQFRNDLSGIMEEELKSEEQFIGKKRIESHIKLIESTSDNSIFLTKQYFHSEQSIRRCVKEKIMNFMKNGYKSSQGTIDRHFATNKKALKYIIIDICSFYDMCWCCGDTFASCCHLNDFNDFGAKVFVRTSGCTAYFDQPFVHNSYSLRENRVKFKGFEKGEAYEVEPYKPYIAHAAVEDLK